MSDQRECATKEAMHNAMPLIHVDKGIGGRRLTRAIMRPDDPPILKHAPITHVQAMLSPYNTASESILGNDGKPHTAPAGTMLSLLGKRRRSPAMQVLAVALRPADCKELSPQEQQRQQQSSLQPSLQGASLQEPQNGSRCFAGSTCAASHAAQCRGSQILRRDYEHDNEFMESPCLSPKRVGSCRLQAEKLICPPPPSKAASKPKEPNRHSYRKKFFVPPDLTELPPALQSLFA